MRLAEARTDKKTDTANTVTKFNADGQTEYYMRKRLSKVSCFFVE